MRDKEARMPEALITGGSEGIGFALAECFARDGIDLILVARNEEKLNRARNYLEERYSVKTAVFSRDLSLAGAAGKLFAEVADRDIRYVINNAGFGTAGSVCDIPAERDERMITVNDISLTVLTKLFAAKMSRENGGVIMNIASTGAFLPGPYIASYYASKAYVLSYTKAAAEELRGSGVHVCCLCPGPVQTEFYAASGQSVPSFVMSAEACADYAYRKMKTGKTVIIPGLINRIMRFVPEPIAVRYVMAAKRRQVKTKEKRQL